MHGFDVYFAGEIAAGQNLAEVKTRIGRAFRLSDDKLDALFCGKPVRVKANIKAEEVGKYRQVFRDAGGLIDIVPAGSKPQVPDPSPASVSVSQPDGIQLLPANTGSLIDTAKPVPKFDLSGVDHLDLAQTNDRLLDNAVTPSFDWEAVSDVEVLPANTGSLEDCAEEKKAVRIPDISGMKLVD